MKRNSDCSCGQRVRAKRPLAAIAKALPLAIACMWGGAAQANSPQVEQVLQTMRTMQGIVEQLRMVLKTQPTTLLQYIQIKHALVVYEQKLYEGKRLLDTINRIEQASKPVVTVTPQPSQPEKSEPVNSKPMPTGDIPMSSQQEAEKRAKAEAEALALAEQQKVLMALAAQQAELEKKKQAAEAEAKAAEQKLLEQKLAQQQQLEQAEKLKQQKEAQAKADEKAAAQKVAEMIAKQQKEAEAALKAQQLAEQQKAAAQKQQTAQQTTVSTTLPSGQTGTPITMPNGGPAPVSSGSMRETGMAVSQIVVPQVASATVALAASDGGAAPGNSQAQPTGTGNQSGAAAAANNSSTSMPPALAGVSTGTLIPSGLGGVLIASSGASNSGDTAPTSGNSQTTPPASSFTPTQINQIAQNVQSQSGAAMAAISALLGRIQSDMPAVFDQLGSSNFSPSQLSEQDRQRLGLLIGEQLVAFNTTLGASASDYGALINNLLSRLPPNFTLGSSQTVQQLLQQLASNAQAAINNNATPNPTQIVAVLQNALDAKLEGAANSSGGRDPGVPTVNYSFPYIAANDVTQQQNWPTALVATYNGIVRGQHSNGGAADGVIKLDVNFAQMQTGNVAINGQIILAGGLGSVSGTLMADAYTTIGSPSSGMTGTLNGEAAWGGISNGVFYGPNANETTGNWIIMTHTQSQNAGGHYSAVR